MKLMLDRARIRKWLFLLVVAGISVAHLFLSGTYEVLVSNRAQFDFQDVQVCIADGPCYSGPLGKGVPVWLTKDSYRWRPNIEILARSQAHKFSSTGCEIPAAKRGCTYEVVINDRGVYCPQGSDDCIRMLLKLSY